MLTRNLVPYHQEYGSLLAPTFSVAWKRRYQSQELTSYLSGDQILDDNALQKVRQAAEETGIKLDRDQGAYTGPADEEDRIGKKQWDGWQGGLVWLVPTDKSIEEWKPIAVRRL
jgi:2',3'-cyclic-nucleotide 3'-phosphodiesterase